MSSRRVILFLLAALVLTATPAAAREWTIVGPRALGMGGANVAVANDATASYWNPAAYGFFNRYSNFNRSAGEYYARRKWSVVTSAGADLAVHQDIGVELDRLFRFDFSDFGSGTVPEDNVVDFVQMVDALKSFSEKDSGAITTTLNGGLRVQGSHIGVGGYVLSEISARGDIDLVNIGPVASGVTFTIDTFTDPANYGCAGACSGSYLSAAQKSDIDAHLSTLGWNATQRNDYINAVDNGLTQADAAGQEIPSDIIDEINTVATVADASASSGGSFSDNASRLLFKGIAVFEFPVTYGYAPNDSVSFGANVKYMKARTYNTSVQIFNTDYEDALDRARDDYEDSTNFGVDLGVLYRYGDEWRVGVVARNVNSPKFDMKTLLPGDEEGIKEDAQVRAGVAFMPVKYLTLALDCDLTENDTTVSNSYKSRNVSAGAELDLNYVKLRAGAYKNIAESDIGVVYTAGVGLALWHINLDLGASISSDSATVDDNSVPEEAKVELALSALF